MTIETPILSFEDQLFAVASQPEFGVEGPFSLDLSRLQPAAPIHLVLGDNGSGKSFLVQRLAKVARAAVCSPLQLSMGYRTRGGIERQLMFGDEAVQSTGLASVGVLSRAISSMRSWGANPHVALLDEPDIGLAERFAYPMGQRIAQFALTKPSGTQGVLLVTHSRALVRGVLAELPAGEQPSVILLGRRYASVADFLADASYATLAELDALEVGNRSVRATLRKGS